MQLFKMWPRKEASWNLAVHIKQQLSIIIQYSKQPNHMEHWNGRECANTAPSECKCGANSQHHGGTAVLQSSPWRPVNIWHSLRHPADPSLLIQLTPQSAHVRRCNWISPVLGFDLGATASWGSARDSWASLAKASGKNTVRKIKYFNFKFKK